MSMQTYIKNMMAPLVRWALTNGLDYKDMALLLKPVYLEASQQLVEGGQAKGDVLDLEKLAAISGLSTTDVKALLEHETLEGWQVIEIVNTGRFTPPPPAAQSGPPTGAPAGTPLPEVMKPLPPKIDPGLGSPAPAPA